MSEFEKLYNNNKDFKKEVNDVFLIHNKHSRLRYKRDMVQIIICQQFKIKNIWVSNKDMRKIHYLLNPLDKRKKNFSFIPEKN